MRFRAQPWASSAAPPRDRRPTARPHRPPPTSSEKCARERQQRDDLRTFRPMVVRAAEIVRVRASSAGGAAHFSGWWGVDAGWAGPGQPAAETPAPPSITYVSPVIQLDRSLARNVARLAMSCGSPRRFSGILAANSSPKLSTRTWAKSVATRPGAIPTTRVGPNSTGELSGHVDQRGLGQVVDPETSAVRTQPADRRDVDDRPRTLLERLLPRRPAPQQRRLEVDLERLVVPTLVDLERASVIGVGGGIVDQDVEPTESFDRGTDRPLPESALPALAAKFSTVADHLRPSGFELILLAAVDHHLRPGSSQRCRDRLANALRSAGDQRNLAVQ